MIESLVGTKPSLYLAILLVALFLRFICIPLIEWAIDLGVRTEARALYVKHDEDRRRRGPWGQS